MFKKDEEEQFSSSSSDEGEETDISLSDNKNCKNTNGTNNNDNVTNSDNVVTAATNGNGNNSNPEEVNPSRMKDAFISVSLFLMVTLLTHGIGGPSPFVLPISTKGNDGVPVAAAPPNLRVRPAAPPRPFFGPDSALDDYYGGDVFAAFAEADLHENALIFFYAPWDADSRAARKVLEIVADIFADSDLYIGAVNCWAPQGECYKNFGGGQSGNKANEKTGTFNPRLPQNQFPILVFYPRDRKGVQYHGPITPEAVVEFLLSARNPLRHIRSVDDLVELKARHNGRAVVGYFPEINSKLATRKSLRQFLSASYLTLESDPFRVNSGGFGAVTSPKLASKLHLGPNLPVRYFFWNGTSVAFPNKTITSGISLANWMNVQLTGSGPSDALTSWIGVIGRKSNILSQKLFTGSGNSLIVFIPRVNRFTYNEALSIVQEASILYRSCPPEKEEGDTSSTSEIRQLLTSIRKLRAESREIHETFFELCRHDSWFVKTFQDRPFCQATTSEAVCNILSKSNSSLAGNVSLRFPVNRRRPRPGQPTFDPQINEVVKMQTRLDCTLSHLVSQTNCRLEFPANEDEAELEAALSSLNGLGCHDNRSLNFFTLDFNSQNGLAKILGLKERTAQALIVVPSQSTYYRMLEPFSLTNLSKFIINFHRSPNNLTEAKLSRGSLTLLETETTTKPRNNNFVRENTSHLHLPELNRENFLTLDRGKPLLLLYLSPSCGFCSAAVRAFHAVRRIFASSTIADSMLNFSTINTSINDLPWNFAAFTTPSVLFVPAGSDTAQTFHSESRVFPSDKPINVTNLMNFVAANLPEETRVRLIRLIPEMTSSTQYLSTSGHEATGPSPNLTPTKDGAKLLPAKDDIFQTYRDEL